ncbi:MAG: vitamin K epoxide reductase family protein [Anaerolineae bacterium]|nr:vitamin K epoxide reductase family protein [Anaerolineae bacterium]
MSVALTAQRSPNWLRILGVLFAVLGLLVATYMSYAELTGQETSCPGATGESFEGSIAVDCGLVQNSVYAKLLGIPVAIVGFGGYLAILAVWLLEDRVQLLREWGHMLVFGMALFGFLFTLYLTWAEFFRLQTVCTWCITSAVFMTLVFIISIIRLIQHFRQPASA